MKRRGVWISIACLLAFANHAGAKDKGNRLQFEFEGHLRTVYFYAPSDSGAMPVVVLLHGSRRDGTEMLNAWKGLASSEHFLLVAPDSLNTAEWDSKYDPPGFLHAAVDGVKAVHAIDPGRVYLFGHSGGAVYALALALIDSEYYAAAGVHAGALPAGSDHLFTYAGREIPIGLWVGDQDPSFPVDHVRATKDLFEAHGFHVQLTIVPKHGHDYSEASDRVDRQAWQFFAQSHPTPAAATP